MYSWTWRRLDSSRQQGQSKGARSDLFDFALGTAIISALVYFTFFW